jgi:hypothetical protein
MWFLATVSLIFICVYPVHLRLDLFPLPNVVALPPRSYERAYVFPSPPRSYERAYGAVGAVVRLRG